MRRLFNLFKRNFVSYDGRRVMIIPKSRNILEYKDAEKMYSLSLNVFAYEDDDCYTCYNIINDYNLKYLCVRDNNNKLLGFMSRQDIESNILEYEYECEEDEKVRESIRKSMH